MSTTVLIITNKTIRRLSHCRTGWSHHHRHRVQRSISVTSEFVLMQFSRIVDNAYTAPHELTTKEVELQVEEYGKAAKNAMKAGFDGVGARNTPHGGIHPNTVVPSELHSAFGYLPNQFLNDGSNARKDKYGGPVENRVTFVLEAVSALADVWGSGMHSVISHLQALTLQCI